MTLDLTKTNTMKTKSKSIARLAIAAALFGIFASGCHTVRGIGQDVERTGEHIQHGSR